MQVRNRLLQRAHLGRRDTGLPAYQQGLKVLGTPLGTNEFVAVHLHTLSAQHRIFLELLSILLDLQVAVPSSTIHPPCRPASPHCRVCCGRSVLHCLALVLQVRAAPQDPLPNLAQRRARRAPIRPAGRGIPYSGLLSESHSNACFVFEMQGLAYKLGMTAKSWTMQDLYHAVANLVATLSTLDPIGCYVSTHARVAFRRSCGVS